MQKLLLASFITLVAGTSVIATAQVACTMEYAPVCGKVQVQCIKEPCEPVLQTFGNKCSLDADKNATFVSTGECPSTTAPVDLSTCASYFDGCNTCTVSGGKLGGCTRMYCAKPGTPKCLKPLENNVPATPPTDMALPPQPTTAELAGCSSYYDGCNTCTVENGKLGACTMMFCDKPATPKCLVRATTGTSLDQTIQKIFAKYKKPVAKERAIKRFLQIIQQKSASLQIQGRALTDKEQATLAAYDLLITSLQAELGKVCVAQKGERVKAGKGQFSTCNKKTPDAGKKCTSNDQCSTLCLAPGKCAPTTVNFGCIDVMQQGKKVSMCID